MFKKEIDMKTLIAYFSHIGENLQDNEIVILTKGRLAATGTPDEILAKSGKTNLEEAFLYFNKV